MCPMAGSDLPALLFGPHAVAGRTRSVAAVRVVLAAAAVLHNWLASAARSLGFRGRHATLAILDGDGGSLRGRSQLGISAASTTAALLTEVVVASSDATCEGWQVVCRGVLVTSWWRGQQ
jgi:hypothetical protein